MQSSFWHTLPALSCVSSHRRTLALERTDGGRLQKVPTGSWAGRGTQRSPGEGPQPCSVSCPPPLGHLTEDAGEVPGTCFCRET